jgi:hypothetical protein
VLLLLLLLLLLQQLLLGLSAPAAAAFGWNDGELRQLRESLRLETAVRSLACDEDFVSARKRGSKHGGLTAVQDDNNYYSSSITVMLKVDGCQEALIARASCKQWQDLGT